MKICAGAASRFANPHRRGKLNLHPLNIPAACPPRTVVPVRQAWLRSSSLSPRHSFSVRDATAPTMLQSFVVEPVSFRNRLTNRWSIAKGSTVYGYDAVGNLKTVNYPVSPDLSLAYDALNRLTNLVDAVGTTRYKGVSPAHLSRSRTVDLQTLVFLVEWECRRTWP